VCADQKDNNCNNQIDEDSDVDKDGYRSCSGTADCDDYNSAVYPGALEGIDGDHDGIPDCDGKDNDCDGTIDDGTSCVDDDGDGYVELKDGGSGLPGGDCDDRNRYTYPGALERSDLQDNDCDGAVEGVLSLANAWVRLEGDLSSGYAGSTLSGGGDLNNDDIPDLVIGAYGYDPLYQPSQNRGAAFLLFGRRTGWDSLEKARLVDQSILLYEEEPSARAGFAVTMAGDLNKDGIGDFAVGAPYHSSSSYESVGKTYIVFGKSTGWTMGTLSSSALSIVEGLGTTILSANTLDGYALTGAGEAGRGDLNGDGLDDLVIGATAATGVNATGWLLMVPGSASG
jgi:hypothetical protein